MSWRSGPPPGRPPRPENLAAELQVIELAAKARLADAALWTGAAQLITEGALTVATVARLTKVSERTAYRRLAALRPAGSRAAEGGPGGTPEGRP